MLFVKHKIWTKVYYEKLIGFTRDKLLSFPHRNKSPHCVAWSTSNSVPIKWILKTHLRGLTERYWTGPQIAAEQEGEAYEEDCEC